MYQHSNSVYAQILCIPLAVTFPQECNCSSSTIFSSKSRRTTTQVGTCYQNGTHVSPQRSAPTWCQVWGKINEININTNTYVVYDKFNHCNVFWFIAIPWASSRSGVQWKCSTTNIGVWCRHWSSPHTCC